MLNIPTLKLNDYKPKDIAKIFREWSEKTQEEFAKKFGTTVESAAKLITKYGNQKATKLIESAIATKRTQTKKLADGKKLVEEVAQLDKVNAKPETLTAADFVKPGMITNAFNLQALGKKMDITPFDKLDGEKIEGENQAQALLRKYMDKVKVEVEDAPKGLDEPATAAEAEKEAKKLLDK